MATKRLWRNPSKNNSKKSKYSLNPIEALRKQSRKNFKKKNSKFNNLKVNFYSILQNSLRLKKVNYDEVEK